jgi:MAM domain, meprin/A5/mu
VQFCVDMKPYSCDFERYGQCGWEQDWMDTEDWMLQSSAGIGDNGPVGDHTSNSTKGIANSNRLSIM